MRVNVDDRLFTDYRFEILTRNLGDKWRALGMCVDFWRAAGKHWAEDGKLMPLKQFEMQGFQPILDVGLAELRADGIYACGLIEHLDWARVKNENKKAAGLASAAARKLKYGSANPRCQTSQVNPTANDSDISSHAAYREQNVNRDEQTVNTCSGVHEQTRTTVNAPAPAPVNLTHTSAPPPERVLLEIWNQECGLLPKAKSLSVKRARFARSRWAEKPDEEYWRSIVRQLASSSFCRGETERGWRADFDFFLKPDTHIQVSEGKFANRIKPKLVVSPGDRLL